MNSEAIVGAGDDSISGAGRSRNESSSNSRHLFVGSHKAAPLFVFRELDKLKLQVPRVSLVRLSLVLGIDYTNQLLRALYSVRSSVARVHPSLRRGRACTEDKGPFPSGGCSNLLKHPGGAVWPARVRVLQLQYWETSRPNSQILGLRGKERTSSVSIVLAYMPYCHVIQLHLGSSPDSWRFFWVSFPWCFAHYVILTAPRPRCIFTLY